MTPLCEKEYVSTISGIVATLIEIALDVVFFLYKRNDTGWFIFILIFTMLIVYQLIEIIYWICQPNVLIYQYDQGIVIKRKIKIEYRSIERIYRKNYWTIKPRGSYYRDPYVGTIYIKLKSGKVHKIRNAFCPLDAVDCLTKIKQQKKFR